MNLEKLKHSYPDRNKVLVGEIVTLQDLYDFKLELLTELKSIFRECGGQPSRKWLKSSQVKKALGISASTLQILRNNGTVPFTKIGGTIYYDTEEINRLLKTSRFNKDQ